jgi:hypothetical protein
MVYIKTNSYQKMKKNLFIPVVAIILLMFASSCKKDKVSGPDLDPNCSDTISFVNEILPTMQNNCTGCHNSGNSTGYTITNHTNISSNASAILNAMRASNGFQLMPQGGPALNDSLIQEFSCWIDQGKKNN